jgi:hypothetical protein
MPSVLEIMIALVVITLVVGAVVISIIGLMRRKDVQLVDARASTGGSVAIDTRRPWFHYAAVFAGSAMMLAGFLATQGKRPNDLASSLVGVVAVLGVVVFLYGCVDKYVLNKGKPVRDSRVPSVVAILLFAIGFGLPVFDMVLASADAVGGQEQHRETNPAGDQPQPDGRVLRRYVGVWNHQSEETRAGQTEPVKRTSEITAVSILNGKFVQFRQTESNGEISNMQIATADPATGELSLWIFKPNGAFVLLAGIPDPKIVKIRWQGTAPNGLILSSQEEFISHDEIRYSFTVKTKTGEIVSQSQGVLTRKQ